MAEYKWHSDLAQHYSLGLIHYHYVPGIYKFVTTNMFNCHDTKAFMYFDQPWVLLAIHEYLIKICGPICERTFYFEG